jgi:transcriptional regulator with XRE-family HTH domain
MSKKAFGKTLKKFRLESNLTQEFLAEKVDVDRTYIYRLEYGLREPSFFIFKRIIDALEISANDFMESLQEETKIEQKASKAQVVQSVKKKK